MALAESTHHGAQRQKTARAGGEARDALHGVPEAPLRQGRVLRHVVGRLSVPALDVRVPQMVDQLPDIVQFFRVLSPDPEQVIEVPKILPFDVRMRPALCVTQLVEQLVEVPTITTYSSLQRTVEPYVDIPVPGGGGLLAGLQGFSSGQSSTASPSSKKRISERIVEQIVDPVSSGRLSWFSPRTRFIFFSLSSQVPAVLRVPHPSDSVHLTGPRSSASWSVWTRQDVHVHSWFLLVIMQFVLCSL